MLLIAFLASCESVNCNIYKINSIIVKKLGEGPRTFYRGEKVSVKLAQVSICCRFWSPEQEFLCAKPLSLRVVTLEHFEDSVARESWRL